MPFAALPYLLDFLLEIGPTGVGAMSAVPLSFQDIESWERVTCIRLEPWEVLTIRRLSAEWCAQAELSMDDQCPPPWDAPVTDAELAKVARSLREDLGRMAS